MWDIMNESGRKSPGWCRGHLINISPYREKLKIAYVHDATWTMTIDLLHWRPILDLGVHNFPTTPYFIIHVTC